MDLHLHRVHFLVASCSALHLASFVLLPHSPVSGIHVADYDGVVLLEYIVERRRYGVVCRWYIDVDNGDRSQRRSDVDGLASHIRRTTSFCVDESIADESDKTTFSCWSVGCWFRHWLILLLYNRVRFGNVDVFVDDRLDLQ